jgi:hypothetical protein
VVVTEAEVEAKLAPYKEALEDLAAGRLGCPPGEGPPSYAEAKPPPPAGPPPARDDGDDLRQLLED